MNHQAPSLLTPPIPEVAACLDDVTAVRHDLHAHPELGFQEVRTAAVAAAKLREYGCDEVYEGIGRTGVVGVIKGSEPGPVLTLALAQRMPRRFAPIWMRCRSPRPRGTSGRLRRRDACMPAVMTAMWPGRWLRRERLLPRAALPGRR